MTEDKKLQAQIIECDAEHRRAVMSAMKATGWRRRVHLWFARLFDRLGDEVREVSEEQKRGGGKP